MTGIFLWRRSVHRTRHGDSPISAIISISHGTGNYTAAGRSIRSGRTQPDGTTKVSVYVTREDSTNKAVRADTRTYAQRCTLMDLLRQLRRDYPEARILGHYQLKPLHNARLALALTQGRSMKPYESHTMPPQKIVVIHLLDINYSLLIHRRLELKHYVSNYFYLNK